MKGQEEYDDGYGIMEQARQGFVKKVYTILACQLAFTFVFAMVAGHSAGFMAFMARNFWLSVVVMLVAIGLEIAIFCGAGRKYPHNFVLLGAFTVCESYLLTGMVGYFQQTGRGDVVLAALAATALLVGGLTLIAYSNCVDLTGMSGVMSAVSMGVLVLVILGLFFGGGGLISGLLVLAFGVFLVYDTQLILGRGEQSLSSDDYIIAALMIYLDIIIIFTELLKLFSSDE